MSTYRFGLTNGGRLEIDTDALGEVLTAAGREPLNLLAASARDVARGKVRPSGKRFVGMRAAKVFQMQSTDIGQPPSALSSRLRLPVALVYNNSRFAVQQEVGSLKADLRAERPLTTALKEVGAQRGVRALRAKTLATSVDFGNHSRASRRKGRR